MEEAPGEREVLERLVRFRDDTLREEEELEELMVVFRSSSFLLFFNQISDKTNLIIF